MVSMLSALPFLLVLSLFSTIVCPPPSQPKSSASHFVLSPFGLHDGSSQHSALHETLCYPANLYHDQILEPYVYPVIQEVQSRATQHPLYDSTFVPAKDQAIKISNQVIAVANPIVDRIHKGIRRIYLTFIDPHVPYLKARAHEITSPYAYKARALYDAHLAPHVAVAAKHFKVVRKQACETFKWAKSHPYTGHASRYAADSYAFTRVKSQQAYKYSHPHVVRFAQKTDKFAREVLGPKAVDAIEWVLIRISRGAAFAKM